MTISELKKELEEFNDDTEIGVMVNFKYIVARTVGGSDEGVPLR